MVRSKLLPKDLQQLQDTPPYEDYNMAVSGETALAAVAMAAPSLDRWHHGLSISIRIHDGERVAMFTPSRASGIDDVAGFTALRITVVVPSDGSPAYTICDSWKDAQ